MNLEVIVAREFDSIPALIRVHARERPRHPALVQDEHRLDYAGLDALMDRVAAALQRDGLRPRDTVAICAATSIEYGAVYLGALRAGMAVAPLAPLSTAASIATMALDADRLERLCRYATRPALCLERLSTNAAGQIGSSHSELLS